jgi:hypothetical protein
MPRVPNQVDHRKAYYDNRKPVIPTEPLIKPIPVELPDVQPPLRRDSEQPDPVRKPFYGPEPIEVLVSPPTQQQPYVPETTTPVPKDPDPPQPVKRQSGVLGTGYEVIPKK